MISVADILRDAFDRVHEQLPPLIEDLDEQALLWRPAEAANSIGWIAWHLTRVQDDHLAGVGHVDQAWTAKRFADRFALPYAAEDIGYGQDSDQVGLFYVDSPAPLIEYHNAVHELTVHVLDGLDDTSYARIVDHRWDPPVTAAVRLVSVIGDTMAHLGQIGYIRGLR